MHDTAGFKIKAVIGLGNPGAKYENTRHNVGFRVLDRFLSEIKTVGPVREQYSGIYTYRNISGRCIHFLKPMTFMNLSGNSVRKLLEAEELKPQELLVLHDDMDFDLGTVRIKLNGGSAGHNGLESIFESLQDTGFARLRIGIGRNPGQEMKDHVLDKFREDEVEELEKAVRLSVDAIKLILARDIHMAMNITNAIKPNKDNTGEEN